MKKTVCNMCGRDFNVLDEENAFHIRQEAGYPSKYDGCSINLDLCCDCFDSLIEYIVPKCKISPVEEPDDSDFFI